MTEPMITCPHCHRDFKLNETLAAPLIESTRLQFQSALAEKEEEIRRRESAIAAERAAITDARKSIDDEVATKIAAERKVISKEEAEKAKLALSMELADKEQALVTIQEVLKDRDSKLAEAQKAQAQLLRKERELEDAKREVELTIEKKVQESLLDVRNKAKQEAEESLRLKVAEREQTISAMQKQIEELKRKAEQGSQQLQGEVQELALEALLTGKFPRDTFAPVPRGDFGGDLQQHVFDPFGQRCGTILWEAKRTKHWSDGWLSKLRDDQRAAKADLAVIVSHALPKGVEGFDLIDGVWVVEPRFALAIAIALRQSLIELAAARKTGEGQQTKMELVYQYLTGPRFRLRVEAIVEKFTDMQSDLDRERKTMTRLWAKREEQIRGVIETTAGMYGDLQGIAGKTFQEIQGLDVPLLESADAEDGR